MAEKDATARLRRAVKENNLFLVKRLIQRTDMRNPDTAPRRYTSLAWAAVLGHEETFEFLLTAGHDDEELSRDSENNTILMLLADQKPSSSASYVSSSLENNGAHLRMARLYYERYSWILDWSNIHGKTALHIAALKGDEELVRTVQLLIERGCQYSARNNQGFTASDYAYSFVFLRSATRDTLQDTARAQFEINKKQRRNIFAQAAQAAARGNDWGSPLPFANPPPVPAKDGLVSARMRRGSVTSRTTTTSESEDPEVMYNGQLSSSPSQPSTGSSSAFVLQPSLSQHTPHMPIKKFNVGYPIESASALSPIANRMRERDADAMEKYLNRNRSGSQGTASTDNKSQSGSFFASAGPSSHGDDIGALSGTMTPRKLRPSASAAQLRTTHGSSSSGGSNITQSDSRNRSGTSSSASRGAISALPSLARSSSTSKSLRSIASADRLAFEDAESYTGPPSHPITAEEHPTPTNGRRKAFHILAKPLQTFDSSAGTSHRRGMSSASVRGS
ncbi:hypothetical protein CPB84DRAFT_1832824 [Gymnopilus junonius]|uniref:Ankyrin n=1 Tax=Gymnopilus junonius TaxID=109634 RepID=A0A9P5NYV3_GYMJU|nr:hypothetical protein CPB84DRAFT_1832824 [Gymnopilus junonius]